MFTETSPDSKQHPIRGPRGQFAKGNPGGPGRPPRATEANYYLAVAEAIPLDRWRSIVEAAAKSAEEGDAQARAWLTKILIGSDPGRLSETLAGVLHEGEHYRVAEALDRRAKKAEDDEDDADLLDPGAVDRRDRVQAMLDTLVSPE
jgi:hypothetical protein